LSEISFTRNIENFFLGKECIYDEKESKDKIVIIFVLLHKINHQMDVIKKYAEKGINCY
jgi:hypothetical protein